MAIYFDIIINLEELFRSIVDLKINDEAEFYISYWNETNKSYLKEIDPINFDFSDFNINEYRGFFMVSKSANFKLDKSCYDDEYFPFSVEIKGGKEDIENLELIKFRRLAKNPDKSINKAYEKLQSHFKKNTDFSKGVNWGKHFYKNIYFDKKTNKKVWGDLNKKDFEIKINTTDN